MDKQYKMNKQHKEAYREAREHAREVGYIFSAGRVLHKRSRRSSSTRRMIKSLNDFCTYESMKHIVSNQLVELGFTERR